MSKILQETGSVILLETGDALLLELDDPPATSGLGSLSRMGRRRRGSVVLILLLALVL
jgi:hypothetical protein